MENPGRQSGSRRDMWLVRVIAEPINNPRYVRVGLILHFCSLL
jgi:hypothetical protein